MPKFLIFLLALFTAFFLADKCMAEILDLQKTKYIFSKKEFEALPPKDLTKTEMLEDIQYFRHIFEKAYGAYEIQGKKVWDLVFSKLNLKISSKKLERSKTEIFLAMVSESLNPFVDGHFSIAGNFPNEYKIFAVKDNLAPYLVEKRCENKADILKLNPRTSIYFFHENRKFEDRKIIFLTLKKYTSEFAFNQNIQGCVKQISQYLYPDKPEGFKASPSNWANAFYSDQDWNYLKINSLSGTNPISKFLEYLEFSKLKNKNLILDLRGAGGGGFETIEELFLRMGLLIDCPYEINRERSNIYSLQLKTNFLNQKIFESSKNKDRVSQWNKGINKNLKNLKVMAIETNHVETIKYKHKKTKDTFRMKITALMDVNCNSGCEGILGMIRSYPRSTTIGVNSSGTFLTRESNFIIMPNSKIHLGFSDQYFPKAASMASFKERRGFLPDVWYEIKDTSPWSIVKKINLVYSHFR